MAEEEGEGEESTGGQPTSKALDSYPFLEVLVTPIVKRGSTYIGTDYSAFLRRRDVENEDFATDFNLTYQKLKASGLLLELGSPNKLSNISTYSYDETLDFLTDLFYKDAKIFLSSGTVIG